MEENITNKRLYVIAELHELINSLTKDTGAVRRIQYLKQGRSPYFYLNAGLTYMSETFEPSEKLTIVMHIPADHLDGYRVVSSRVEEIFQKVIGEKNLQIIWLNNSTDMIDCDGNYHVIFQAPYVIAKNPSVYEFEKACEDSPNVIFSHMNHTWERIAKDLKTVM